MKAEGKVVKNTGTIGGSVNMPYKKLEYTGVETETAKVTVDNGTRTIAVDGKYEAGDNVTIIGNIISATGEVTRERLNEVRAELERQINTKQNSLIPGTHIQIDENGRISVVGVASEEEFEATIAEINRQITRLWSNKQDVISDLVAIRAGAALGDTAVQPADLASTLENYPTKTEVNNALDTLDAELNDKLNEKVIIENDNNKISYNGDTVTLTLQNKNLKTGASGSKSEVIELANSTTAGLMSPADVNAITDLVDRVNALEGTKVRIAYTAGSNPTPAQIKAFVDEYFAERGKPSPTDEDYNSVSVVVDSTKHIWNYYANNHAYQDDGLDTVSQFTNDTAGIILGTDEADDDSTDGKIYAENDGTGSVIGWGRLKTRVDNLESENDTQDQEISALQDAVDDLEAAVDTKQDLLVSGTNIKTINNQSIVGSGNLEINSGVWGNITGTLSDQTDLQTALDEKANSADLADVATSGSYNDLSDKPNIPPEVIANQPPVGTPDKLTNLKIGDDEYEVGPHGITYIVSDASGAITVDLADCTAWTLKSDNITSLTINLPSIDNLNVGYIAEINFKGYVQPNNLTIVAPKKLHYICLGVDRDRIDYSTNTQVSLLISYDGAYLSGFVTEIDITNG